MKLYELAQQQKNQEDNIYRAKQHAKQQESEEASQRLVKTFETVFRDYLSMIKEAGIEYRAHNADHPSSSIQFCRDGRCNYLSFHLSGNYDFGDGYSNACSEQITLWLARFFPEDQLEIVEQ